MNQHALDAIERVASLLAPSFVFGYHDVEDVKQDCRLMMLELLAKDTYDPSRDLEPYLYTHTRRRLLNKQRDELRRNDPPCRTCHESGSCGDGFPCKKYGAWARRNNVKANLMQPAALENAPESRARESAPDLAELREARALIDEQLPLELRSYYLRMLAGDPIPKGRRHQVIEAVRAILCP